MHRAPDLRLGARDDRDRARLDRGGNEILAVDARAGEGAEDRSGRDLAMVDGEAGDHGVGVGLGRGIEERRETHQSPFSSFHKSGVSSDTSTSRLSSGKTPSIGPARMITFLTTGAAV